MRLSTFLSAALLVLAVGANALASVEFTLNSYTINANNSDPGLVVQTSKILAEPTTFELFNVGDMATFKLFRIWTDETSVNNDDKVAKPISVDFDFSAPPPAFGGTVGGATVGGATFLNISQWGELDWGAPVVLAFGALADGQLQVELWDTIFNQGLFGLKEGFDHGSDVKVKFTLLAKPSEPVGVIPEPATIVVWSLLALAATCASRRFKRNIA